MSRDLLPGFSDGVVAFSEDSGASKDVGVSALGDLGGVEVSIVDSPVASVAGIAESLLDELLDLGDSGDVLAGELPSGVLTAFEGVGGVFEESSLADANSSLSAGFSVLWASSALIPLLARFATLVARGSDGELEVSDSDAGALTLGNDDEAEEMRALEGDGEVSLDEISLLGSASGLVGAGDVDGGLLTGSDELNGGSSAIEDDSVEGSGDD